MKRLFLWEKACSQWEALSLGKACSLVGGTLLEKRRRASGGGMLELQFIWRSSPSLHLLMHTGSRGWRSCMHHSLFHVYTSILGLGGCTIQDKTSSTDEGLANECPHLTDSGAWREVLCLMFTLTGLTCFIWDLLQAHLS